MSDDDLGTPFADEDFPHVAVSQEGAVAVATLTNPLRRNAISAAMWRELAAFAEAVSDDDDVRAVLIRGADGVFSAGADVGGFDADRSGEAARLYDDALERACAAIEAIRQPTVAQLEGPVVGAGAALALSCDLRVAAEDSFVTIPAARLGLGYDPRGVARLVAALGAPAARWLLLTAGRLPVQRLFAAGAVHEVVPADDIEEAVARLLARLADNAPLTLAAAKVAVRAAADPELAAEARRLADVADASDDYAEGRSAFLEKRPPEFEGH